MLGDDYTSARSARAGSSITKSGVAVKLRFKLGINEKDKVLLLQSKIGWGVVFFGVDSPNIYASESAIQFIVQSVKDLAIIINHFD